MRFLKLTTAALAAATAIGISGAALAGPASNLGKGQESATNNDGVTTVQYYGYYGYYGYSPYYYGYRPYYYRPYYYTPYYSPYYSPYYYSPYYYGPSFNFGIRIR